MAVTGLRMKRNRRRRPIRSLPCRRHWRWKKSVRCQQPTSRSLRTFLSISLPPDSSSVRSHAGDKCAFVHECGVVLYVEVSHILIMFDLCVFCSSAHTLVIHTLWCCLVYHTLPFLTVEAIKEPLVNNTCLLLSFLIYVRNKLGEDEWLDKWK